MCMNVDYDSYRELCIFVRAHWKKMRERNSVMELNEVYFWTATIYEWKKLLADNHFKQIIIDCLTFLSNSGKISVYGFVIMPNHVHIIWEMNELNGKEKPYASFLKYTAHLFQKQLQTKNQYLHSTFSVNECSRKQRYWARDPLAIQIQSRSMLQQKLEYCHNNPLQSHWILAQDPTHYYWSSAYDYGNNFQRFTFLKHYFDRV